MNWSLKKLGASLKISMFKKFNNIKSLNQFIWNCVYKWDARKWSYWHFTKHMYKYLVYEFKKYRAQVYDDLMSVDRNISNKQLILLNR